RRAAEGARCMAPRAQGRCSFRTARRLDRIEGAHLRSGGAMRLRIFILCARTTVASADGVTVGLFAPTAPFPSTSARVELASRLGDHLGKALGTTGRRKVFARGRGFDGA